MPHRARLYLNVILIASAIGFALVAGPAGAIAKGVAVVFGFWFVQALRRQAAASTLWTESRAATRERGAFHPFALFRRG